MTSRHVQDKQPHASRGDRIGSVAAAAASTADGAVPGAENRGMPIIGLRRKPVPNLFGRMSAYLRREYALLKKGQDLTLEQLFAALGMAVKGDRLLRKQSASLMFRIASDIKHARDFPTPAVAPGIARPMRVWRQRYDGLERFLPQPS